MKNYSIYDVQDMVEGLISLQDELADAVNELITENENLKERLSKQTKDKIVENLENTKPKKTVEEILYSEYFKEFYGKELE